MCSKSCNMYPCLIFVNFGTPTLYLGLQKSNKKFVNSQKNIAKIGQAGCSSSIIQAALKSVKSEHSTGERQWNVSKAHAPYPSKSSSAISSPQNPPQSKQGGGSCLWRFDLLHPSPPLCRPLIPPRPPDSNILARAWGIEKIDANFTVVGLEKLSGIYLSNISFKSDHINYRG